MEEVSAVVVSVFLTMVLYNCEFSQPGASFNLRVFHKCGLRAADLLVSSSPEAVLRSELSSPPQQASFSDGELSASLLTEAFCPLSLKRGREG